MKAAVALLALAAVPALPAADDATIAAQDTFYDPPNVTIDVGDTVTLDNLGGTHNFHFSDGDQLPPVPATDLREAPEAGALHAPPAGRHATGPHAALPHPAVIDRVAIRERADSDRRAVGALLPH